jgi:hypothetical protein
MERRRGGQVMDAMVKVEVGGSGEDRFVLDLRGLNRKEWKIDDDDWHIAVSHFRKYEEALFAAQYISKKYRIGDVIWVMERRCAVYEGGTKVAVDDP